MKKIILKIRKLVKGFTLPQKKLKVDQTLPVNPVTPEKKETPWKEVSVELYEALKACCGLYPLAVAKQKEAMEKFVKAVEDEQSNK
jgi:hypothetical protein